MYQWKYYQIGIRDDCTSDIILTSELQLDYYSSFVGFRDFIVVVLGIINNKLLSSLRYLIFGVDKEFFWWISQFFFEEDTIHV